MMNPLDDDRPCTVEELMSIITASTGDIVMLPGTPYDEVFENVFIGEGDSALRVNCMKKLGVTHVLNAALGKDRYHVNSNHVMYQKHGIQFLGIEATDFMNCDLSKYFDSTSNFIDNGLKTGGKVFVHCVQGVSRSATLVLAYLMLKRHMQVQDALRMVRAKREICPNDGFLQQLCDLNTNLRKSGHFNESNSHYSSKQDQKLKVSTTAKQTKDSGTGNMDELKPTKLAHVDNVGLSMNEDLLVDSEKVKSDSLCTVEELEGILIAPSNGLMLLPRTSHSRINEHIFIGDGVIAENIIGLQTLGITHVLNAAHNKGVKVNLKLYKENCIEYLGLEMEDTLKFDLTPYLEPAADFIQSATVQHGQVLINCVQGVSRSATLVVAYFMIKHHMTVQSALRLVRETREICPNSFFLQQLCDLNAKLGHQNYINGIVCTPHNECSHCCDIQ